VFVGRISVSIPSRSTAHVASIAVLGLTLIVGCAKAPRGDRLSIREGRRESGALTAELEKQFEAGRFEAADSLSRLILTIDPGNPKGDEVLYLASRANYSLESWAQTVRFAGQLSSKYPLSPRREEAMLLEAQAYGKLGRNYESAEVLSRLLESALDAGVEQSSIAELRRLADEKLSAAELEQLVRAFPSSPLASDVSLRLAKTEFARGNYERSYTLLAELLNQFPEHQRAREIRYLLEVSAGRKADPTRTTTHVELNTIGILLPYTGDYSQFGRTFEEGVRLAVDEFNATAQAPVRCVIGDSKGDPIGALTAVRKLIVDKGVVAVIGSVFTMPSVVAATECNAWKVPMVAPLVREAGFGEIGPWAFQMQPPAEVELAAMARIAVGDLLLERIAVLAPSTSEGRRLSEFFTAEVERLGGEVVIEEYYGSGVTDFREQIGRIKVKAPDGLFIPAGPDELVNVLPQIRFYDMQLQLLGLSSWSSEKLLRLAGSELEGAVFPRSGYYGRAPDAYARFAAKYLQRAGAGEISDVEDVSPVATAAYFGTRFVLDAIAGGAVDREQIRDHLAAELNPGAEVLQEYAETLPMVKVVSGRAVEFARPRRD
jgi:branched-chain amino acid transport system substrate-binding protein